MRSQKNRQFQYGALARQYSIWITSRRCASLQGLIVHHSSGSRQYFESLLEMVSLIDDKLEDLNITWLTAEKRYFRDSPPLPSAAVDRRKEDRQNNMERLINFDRTLKKPEFLVRILMRQNSSWQGEVVWLNSDKTIRFRSTLELVLLMQEAIEMSGEPEAEYEFRSWQEVSAAANSL